MSILAKVQLVPKHFPLSFSNWKSGTLSPKGKLCTAKSKSNVNVCKSATSPNYFPPLIIGWMEKKPLFHPQMGKVGHFHKTFHCALWEALKKITGL